MTIDDLYATCYPVHATEPTRMTVEAPKKAEEVKPEQTAEKAGNNRTGQYDHQQHKCSKHRRS